MKTIEKEIDNDNHYTTWGERNWACYNPHAKPIDDLPTIYGFNNGGGAGFMHGQLLSDDGYGMGSHLCSSEGFMYRDLGILLDRRSDRHESFRKHYPDGYKMFFVPTNELETHEGFQKALKIANSKDEDAESASNLQ